MDPRIAAVFGEAARRIGDRPVKLVEHGPFAWLETQEVLTLDQRVLFLENGAWLPLEGLAAFRHAIASAHAPLDAWEPIVRAHAALTHDAPLLTREDTGDLADPRWYVFPVGAAALEAWHAPLVETGDGGERVLVWFVEHFPHRAEMGRVRVTEHGEVTVEAIGR